MLDKHSHLNTEEGLDEINNSLILSKILIKRYYLILICSKVLLND